MVITNRIPKIGEVQSYGGSVCKIVAKCSDAANAILPAPSPTIHAIGDAASIGKKVIAPLNYPSEVEALLKKFSALIKAADIEGKVIASAEAALALFDTLNSTLSLLSYAAKLPLSLAASLAPLTIYALAGNILLDSYRTYRSQAVLEFMKDLDSFESQLNDPSFVRALSKSAKEVIESGMPISEELLAVLREIQEKLVLVGEINFFLSLTSLNGLLFVAAPIPPAIPLTLIAAATTLKFFLSVYKEYGLKLPKQYQAQLESTIAFKKRLEAKEALAPEDQGSLESQMLRGLV